MGGLAGLAVVQTDTHTGTPAGHGWESETRDGSRRGMGVRLFDPGCG